jgi:hypothetical protein
MNFCNYFSHLMIGVIENFHSTIAEGNLPERQAAAAVAALFHGGRGALQIHIFQ